MADAQENDSGYDGCLSSSSDGSNHGLDSQSNCGSDYGSTASTASLDDFKDETLLEEQFENINIDIEGELELNISMDNTDDITRSFGKTSTVESVIESVQAKNCNYYELELDGRVIPRNITLRDAVLRNGVRLRLVRRTFQIFIRRVDGTTITIDVRASDTIESIKEQFFKTDDVPVHQQRLVFQGKELENARTLQFYKIGSTATLEMVYRLRGGN